MDCFKDFIKDGENALIFDHRSTNPEQHLSRKLESLITDYSFRNKLAKNGAETAHLFSNYNIAQIYLKEFHKLLNE